MSRVTERKRAGRFDRKGEMGVVGPFFMIYNSVAIGHYHSDLSLEGRFFIAHTAERRLKGAV